MVMELECEGAIGSSVHRFIHDEKNGWISARKMGLRKDG